MKKNIIISILLIALPFFSFQAHASINSDLNGFFNNLGYSSNITSPNVYQGQQAGYYSGGSIYARSSGRDVQIAHIDLPSFRSGCGGIDMYTGGFSFINSQNLVNNFKNIMTSSVPAYAFNLALESATPEIATAMKYLNSLANDVNRMNINSCETAAGLVGSVWPKTREAQQQVCQDIGTSKGLFTDYAAARQGCSDGGQMSSTLNSATGAYKNMALNKGNLAWKALQQNSFLANDAELAELFMSLSGSVIINNTGDSDTSNQQYKILPSLAGSQSLLSALLHGGTADIYQCDSTDADGCLNPNVEKVTIASSSALETQVSALLNDMVDKIYSDTPLSSAEVGLLNATRLPLYKMLNVQAAFAGDKSVLDIEDYADVVATDILFQYLDESLAVVKTSSASLQYPDAIMNKFLKNVDDARENVEVAQKNAYAQMNMAAQLIQQTQSLEKMLAGTLSAQMNNTLSWANNMRQT